MKIVICGAGLVGSAIASHLSEEHNDVTVIDAGREYSASLIIMTAWLLVWHRTDRLAEAGLLDAELLIAVTDQMK